MRGLFSGTLSRTTFTISMARMLGTGAGFRRQPLTRRGLGRVCCGCCPSQGASHSALQGLGFRV